MAIALTTATFAEAGMAARPNPHLRGLRWLPAVPIALVLFMGISAVAGFILSAGEQNRLIDYRDVTSSMRLLQAALVDAETGVRGFVLTNKYEYLKPYFDGLRSIEGLQLKGAQSGTQLATIDRQVAQSSAANGEQAPVSRRIFDLRRTWQSAITLTTEGKPSDAEAALESMGDKRVMDELRDVIGSYVAQRRIEADAAYRRISVEQRLMLLINTLGAVIAIAGMSYAFWRSALNARGREAAIVVSTDARREVEELFGMTNMLQSAIDRDDANEVLRATAARLLPGINGRLYVFNNSRDRLDLSTTWGHEGADDSLDYIAPTSCWAIKCGRPFLNLTGAVTLRCAHAGSQPVTLEFPMAARGEVYGLLELSVEGDAAVVQLSKIQPIAMALADAMSLSLSGIALRERLRNQALRDPLTGLYNRRFLEEMLDRFAQDAERRKAPVAAIMIDLDNFKRTNDQFGHAAGDTILREVASVIMSFTRGTDITCRYGGEELAVLLADCSIEQALVKAEQMRVRISELSEPKGPAVTASFGVSAMPDTSTRVVDLLGAADAALYQAKQQGRNCVVAAPKRPIAAPISLVGA
jgi:diguanylate cyclase (GGDEF)-like protein